MARVRPELIFERAAALDEERPRQSDPAPGAPGNDAAALLRETRTLLKATALYVVALEARVADAEGHVAALNARLRSSVGLEARLAELERFRDGFKP